MSDNAMGFGLMAMVVLLAAIVASCTARTNDRDNAAVVEMVVKSGADPVAAKCAVRDDGKACFLAAIRK